LSENQKVKDYLESLGIDVRIILEWILEKYGWIHLGQDRDQLVGSCEHSNEPLGPMKGREFLDKLKDY
jgi:hypothetical protein